MLKMDYFCENLRVSNRIPMCLIAAMRKIHKIYIDCIPY